MRLIGTFFFSYEPPTGFISIVDSANAISSEKTPAPVDSVELDESIKYIEGISEGTSCFAKDAYDREASPRGNTDSRSSCTRTPAPAGRRIFSSRDYLIGKQKSDLDFSPKDLVDAYGMYFS